MSYTKTVPAETTPEETGCKLTKYFVLLQDGDERRGESKRVLHGRENAAFALGNLDDGVKNPAEISVGSAETINVQPCVESKEQTGTQIVKGATVTPTAHVTNCCCRYQRDVLSSGNSDTGVSPASDSSETPDGPRQRGTCGNTIPGYALKEGPADGVSRTCATCLQCGDRTASPDESSSLSQDESYDDWRLSLEEFTSKRLGEKRKSSNLSRELRSFYKKQDELIGGFEELRDTSLKDQRQFYRSQDALINHYEEVRLELDDTMETTEYITKLRKRASLFAKITFAANLLLLGIKVVAVVMSGSISLISSLVDSSVDLLSGVVIWITTRAVKKTDRYVYPQGRTKLEPISIVILSVIMSVASLQIIKESFTKIIGLSDGSQSPPFMDWATVGIASATVVVKLVLFLVCRRVPHPTVQALAQDHRNDVLSNTVAILFGYIGSQQMQLKTNVRELIYLDPAGALAISVYIIVMWCITGWDQIKLLVGHTATPEFLSKITWICVDHHKLIQKVDTVRAFHFGNHFLVEVDVVLPPEMTLRQAHDIAEPLQQKLEKLPTVERAFVHIDYEAVHNPTTEHKQV